LCTHAPHTCKELNLNGWYCIYQRWHHFKLLHPAIMHVVKVDLIRASVRCGCLFCSLCILEPFHARGRVMLLETRDACDRCAGIPQSKVCSPQSVNVGSSSIKCLRLHACTCAFFCVASDTTLIVACGICMGKAGSTGH
jgi:hypothetical protein